MTEFLALAGMDKHTKSLKFLTASILQLHF